MYKSLKIKIALAMVVVLLGGAALMSAPHHVGARVMLPTPDPAQCSVQDTSNGTADATNSVVEADNVDLQCGDQTGADMQVRSGDSSAANSGDGDNVQQQDGPQSQNDGQPETPDNTAP